MEKENLSAVGELLLVDNQIKVKRVCHYNGHAISGSKPFYWTVLGRCASANFVHGFFMP